MPAVLKIRKLRLRGARRTGAEPEALSPANTVPTRPGRDAAGCPSWGVALGKPGEGAGTPIGEIFN